MRIPICILLVGALQGALGQGSFYTCDFIQAFASCDHFITDSYCGTNLVTYANKCEFSKAHCTDPTIDLRHVGDCTSAELGATTVAGNEVILDFFCTALSKQDCPITNGEKVCASDGRAYPSYCEYEKQKCTHRGLTVVSYGDCPAN